MKSNKEYQSFNADKTIEELQYNLLQKRDILRHFITESDFYISLLNAPIYKPQTLNLFENLEGFKVEILQLNKSEKTLLNEVGLQIHQIDKKMECQDLVCDNFFVKEIDDLEENIFAFQKDASSFKSRIFQYLQHVIID